MLNKIENCIVTFFYDEKLKILNLKFDGKNFDKVYSYRKVIDEKIVKPHYVYTTIPQHYETIEEIFLINDFDQNIFFASTLSLISRINDYPRGIKILNTSFKSYCIEIMNALEDYNFIFYTEEEIKTVFHNKSFLIKRLLFSLNNYQFSNRDENTTSKNSAIELCSNAFFRTKVFIGRSDGQTGWERILINKIDVENLFKKYNFFIIDSFSKYSFYEKSIILNYFDTIIFEGGAGIINLFLIDKYKKLQKKIYSLDPPTYHPCSDSTCVAAKVECINIGEIDTSHELYNKSVDILNQPWKVNLQRLEELLKNKFN